MSEQAFLLLSAQAPGLALNLEFLPRNAGFPRRFKGFCELLHRKTRSGLLQSAGNMKCKARTISLKIVFILIAGLLSARVCAVEFSVGIGLSDGQDTAAREQDYARLERDIRALRSLERQLDRLGRQDPPAQLQDEARAEWQRQSEWLLQQSKEVAALAEEVEEYLRESRHAAGRLFDYQSAKFKSVQRLDAMEDAAEKYRIKGEAAAERQQRAVKLIARTY